MGIEELCRRHHIEVRPTSEEKLTEMSSGVHNGFVAELEEASAAVRGMDRDRDLVVLLEDIQDPRNLGAILRVCEGAGVGRVLLRDRGSAPISPAVVKTAAGATEWLEVERIVNPARAIEELKRQGYWIYGTGSEGQPPWEIDLRGQVVLCFGGEEKGLRARTRKVCDALIGLPMRGAVESLNVSAATAAVVYEAIRQRLSSDPLPPAGDSS